MGLCVSSPLTATGRGGSPENHYRYTPLTTGMGSLVARVCEQQSKISEWSGAIRTQKQQSLCEATKPVDSLQVTTATGGPLTDFSSVSCRQLQITTTPSFRSGNKVLSFTSYPPSSPIQKAAGSAQQSLQNQYCIQIHTTIDSCL